MELGERDTSPVAEYARTPPCVITINKRVATSAGKLRERLWRTR